MNHTALAQSSRTVMILLIYCFLVRAGVGLWLAFERPREFVAVDGAEYLDTARNIVSGRGYSISSPRPWDWESYQPARTSEEQHRPRVEVFRPPLYSIALAALLAVVPNGLWPIALLDALLSTAAGWFLFDLGRRALASVAGQIGLLFYASYPLAVALGAKIGAEPLFELFLCASVWALWRTRETGRTGFALVAGLFLGLATLTRSNSIFLWPCACVWLALFARQNRLAAAWFTLLLFLTMLPWAARNRLQTGHWIFLSGSGGYNFWLGNNETAYRMFTARSSEEYDRWGKMLLQEIVPQKARLIGTSDVAIAQQFWYDEAKGFIKNNPGLWLRLLAAKAVEFWRPYLRPLFFPRSLVILSALTTLPLLILGWWGIILLFRGCPAFAWLLLLVVISGMTGLVLSHVHVRLRVPFVDTFFCVSSGFALASCWKKRPPDRSPSPDR